MCSNSGFEKIIRLCLLRTRHLIFIRVINGKSQDDVTTAYLKPSRSGHPKVILAWQGGPALALRPVSPANGLESSCQQRQELWEFFQRACGGAQDYNRFTSGRRMGITLS